MKPYKEKSENEIRSDYKYINEDSEAENRTFYEKGKNKNTASFHNHRSFLLKDNNIVQDAKISSKHSIKKKCKNKTKVQPGSKRKTHTKGNNSVYTKDFEKLMKERNNVDNKSLRRMKILRD